MDSENKKLIEKHESGPDGAKSISRELQYYSAPLPHPSMMAEYERIVPGSADRIIKRFEAQSEHRHRIEKIFVWTQSIKSLGGLGFGFVIAMTAILGGIYTALQDRPWLGGSLSFAGLAILVGSFVAEKYLPAKDEEGKKDKK